MHTNEPANVIISSVKEPRYSTYQYPLTHIFPKHKLDAFSDRGICL